MQNDSVFINVRLEGIERDTQKNYAVAGKLVSRAKNASDGTRDPERPSCDGRKWWQSMCMRSNWTKAGGQRMA